MKFSELQESDWNKSFREGSPITLRCDLAHDPSAHVDWYKDGRQLLPQNKVEIESEGLTRTLLIHSAEITHGGTYECSTSDDTVTFKVDVKGDLFLSLQSSYPHTYKSILFYAMNGFVMLRRTWYYWLGSVFCPLHPLSQIFVISFS